MKRSRNEECVSSSVWKYYTVSQVFGMKSFGCINTDILSSILSTLPIKSLSGLKCVSKARNHLISDRSFIQAHWQKTGSIISGFFFQEKYQWVYEDIKRASYISIDDSKAQVHNVVFSFLPEDAVISSSCNGLVCCRSHFPYKDHSIYVCNPLNKEWVTLTWPPCQKDVTFALVFDPSKDPIHSSTYFMVVTAEVNHKNKEEDKEEEEEEDDEEIYCTFNTYYSDTDTWKKLSEICKGKGNLHKNKGIYNGKYLHWLTDKSEILTFDPANELSLLIRVPMLAIECDAALQSCIGEFKDRLYDATFSEEGIQVWCLEDYFECDWRLKCRTSFQQIEKENPNLFFVILQQRVVKTVDLIDLFAFKDGLLLMKVYAMVYLYNVETGSMIEVCSLKDLGPNSFYGPTVIPHSMSLVPLN